MTIRTVKTAAILSGAVILVSLIVLPAVTAHAHVYTVYKGGTRLLDEALDVASRVSGRTLTPAGRSVARTQLQKAALKHEDNALLAARNGGLELIEVAAKYGDDVWIFASRVPRGARFLAMRPQELIPLTRRIGTEVLEFEARYPGMTTHVVRNFGDAGVRYFSRHVPVKDVHRLVGYADMADSPATRRILLDTYKKGGADFLDKLSWKHIVATGLSTSMVITAYQLSDGIQVGLKTVAESSPDTFEAVANHTITILTQPVILPATLFGIGLVCIWLSRYYTRTRRKTSVDSDPYQNVSKNAE